MGDDWRDTLEKALVAMNEVYRTATAGA